MFLARNTKLSSWIFLIIAILFEVSATSFLKMFNGKIYSYIFVAIFIGISYYFMALAIRKIQVGIAYAIWEVVGSILVVLVSIFMFNEILNSRQIIGILLALLGILLINIGEVK